MLWVAAVVLLVVAVGVGIRTGAPLPDAPQLERYATAVGEVRRIELLDGSEMTLGGASSVAVEYGAETRRVVLADGEILLKVARQLQRPFVVEAGGGYARVLGTVFSVRRGTEGVTVGVAEGLVEVGLSGADAAPVRLPLGREVTYSASAGVGPVRAISPERVGAWSRGVLTFIDRPLAAVVADINRYSPRLVVIDNETLKSLRVTGTVSVQGIDEWLKALQNVSAIELDDSGTDWVLRRADAHR
jgi:transmembrane sensor